MAQANTRSQQLTHQWVSTGLTVKTKGWKVKPHQGGSPALHLAGATLGVTLGPSGGGKKQHWAKGGSRGPLGPPGVRGVQPCSGHTKGEPRGSRPDLFRGSHCGQGTGKTGENILTENVTLTHSVSNGLLLRPTPGTAD